MSPTLDRLDKESCTDKYCPNCEKETEFFTGMKWGNLKCRECGYEDEEL